MAPWQPHDAGVNDSMVVEQFKALGDPVRWMIVRELRGGLRCACELADVAEVSPPLLSHHLRVLREAGLIVGTKRGRWIDYTLNRDALTELFAACELQAVA
jgi:ArsR family transcriptional regulator